MQLRTFLAKDMQAALAQVRAELGENAVIVGSQKAKDGSVLLRAAIEESERRTERDNTRPPPADEPRLVTKLRGGPAETAKRSNDARPAIDRATLLGLLRAERTPDSLAHNLAEHAEKSGLQDLALALASALDSRMKTRSVDMRNAGSVLLTGPNGAGKTTVAAKLAAHAKLANRVVRFVATDTTSAGALSRLETFAAHLDSAVVIAEDGLSFAHAVAAAAKDNAFLIADSRGFDPRDHEFWRDFLTFPEAASVEIVGVLSALSDAEESAEMAHALKELGAGRLIVTGLDTARRRGTVVALAAGILPVAHVSRSPFLAEGLEPLTSLSLAREIVAHAGSAVAARTGRTV
jgi:flagellar biosynthesis protein FlhF